MKTMYKIITALVVVSVLVMIPLGIKSTGEEIEIKVTDKERINELKSSKYLIFTETETFENSDTILYLKFDSSDVYSNLKQGEEYKVLVYGWRIPFLSMYRNIVRIES